MNTTNTIKKIVIVGGGTAGWLSAAYLNKLLNNTRQNCKITLIESSDIPTVGVGEATIPTLIQTFKFLGFSEQEWMTRCNATFKMAIKFVNWAKGDDVYWHPFSKQHHAGGFPLSYYWLRNKHNGNNISYDYSCINASYLCDIRKAPKTFQAPEYQGAISYAYHLDTGLLATFLKEKSMAAGVDRVVDKVVDVVLNERGFINHLVTEKSGDLAADLFIDCSGFRGILINQALKEPFVSYQDALFCDRAIAMTIPYEEGDLYNEKDGGINPYTSATALKHGWVWHTPLVSRSGNGYVYSSNFTTPEAAEAELRAYLGKKSEKCVARHLKFKVGKTRRTWVKNCLAIGLSSGFIEPLESTGIHLIEAGLKILQRNFPDLTFPEPLIKNYNREIQERYEEIRDFIVLHYCITKREDTPFWQANKYHQAIPKSLQEKLELWQHIFPNNLQRSQEFFSDHSHVCILAGMGFEPKISPPILDYQSEEQAELMLLQLKQKNQYLQYNLPSHSDYLKQMFAKSARLTTSQANSNQVLPKAISFSMIG